MTPDPAVLKQLVEVAPGLFRCTPDDKNRQYLVGLGIEIEDVAAVWGADYQGQYRWMVYSAKGELVDFGDLHYDESSAWIDAWSKRESITELLKEVQ